MKLDDLKLVEFLEDSQVFSIVINTESKEIVFIHNSLAKELEFHREEIINEKITKIMPNEVCNLIFEKNKKDIFFMEDGRLINKHGNQIPFKLFYSQSMNENYLLIHAIKSKTSGDILVEKKEFDIFNSIAKISRNLLVVIDNKGKIIKFNNELEKLIGFSVQEIEGKYFWDFFIKTEKERIKDIFFKQLECKSNPFSFVSELQTKSNEVVEISWSYSIICNKKEVEYIIATGINVSAQERAIAEANKYSEVLETLLSVLRHDLQNDLLVIEGMIDVYLETEDKHLLHRALRAVNRGFQLIHRINILHETLSSALNFEIVSLKEVIKKIIIIYLAEPIEFTINGDAEVNCDKLLIFALSNIISNAIKHGKANKIEFNIKKDNEEVILEIQNNGSKIDQSIKEYIFDKGFSAGEHRGSGLGLYLVKKILERYNASIEVSSNNNGKVVFRIVFPQ
ncbi:MAG: ATP-binding protein [Candidatus Heimdallarchaeaceae archaeon]